MSEAETANSSDTGNIQVNPDARRLGSALAGGLLIACALVFLADPFDWQLFHEADDGVRSPAQGIGVPAVERVSFSTRDGALIHANLHGDGARGVVLAHGARFDKESWHEQIPDFVGAGFRVLAIDFRGYGQSRAPTARSPAEDARSLDVLAAVDYLRRTGATTVSVVGASMGGDHAAEAAEADPDKIDRLVLLAAGAYTPLIESRARKLFIMSRDDVIGDDRPRLPQIRSQYERASDPKELISLDGSAHAQHIFGTNQGNRLMQEILRFLSMP